MTTLTAPYDLGQSFYVPEFEVRLAGEELPHDVIKDVISVTYKDSLEEIDSFELVVNNWDATRNLPKFVPHAEPRYERIFDPGKKVTLKMGYLGDLRLMLTGTITTLEVDFPAAGGSTLSISGLNELHELRTEQHTMSWENKRDSDIARELGRMPRQKKKAGLGMEVRTNPAAHETEETYVLMDNQHDIVFLLLRARRHGYEVVLREGEEAGDRHLYFGPSESQTEAPTYRLERGRSLVSFKPTITTANQIAEVTVRGWHRSSNRRIEGKATLADLIPAGVERSRMDRLAEAFGSRSLVVTDQPVHTRAEAKRRAKDLLRQRVQGMVEASGKTVGLPDLRAGRHVQIQRFGPLIDGRYYVTESTHTISEGYQTDFKVRRETTQDAAP